VHLSQLPLSGVLVRAFPTRSFALTTTKLGTRW